MAKEEGVVITVADQCMYGLKTWSKDRSIKYMPAIKITKFMTNSPCIAEELSRRCKGQHVHQQLMDGRAKEAAIYPEPLCRAICVGLIREMKKATQQLRSLMTVRHDTKITEEYVDTKEGKKKRGVSHAEDEE